MSPTLFAVMSTTRGNAVAKLDRCHPNERNWRGKGNVAVVDDDTLSAGGGGGEGLRKLVCEIKLCPGRFPRHVLSRSVVMAQE